MKKSIYKNNMYLFETSKESLYKELSYRLTHNPEDATYPAIYREFHKGILFTIGIQLNKSLNEMMEVLKWVKIMK